MAGDGAAGERVVDLLKAAVLAQELFDSLHDLRIHAGVGDEHALLVEIVVILDAVGHIALDRLGERAAVLFRNAHLALVHLDAGLELQKIRAQRRDGRAPAALAQIFERVDHEADVQLLPALVKDRLDLLAGLALAGEQRAVDHEMADTGGETARIDNEHAPRKFLCGIARVLEAGGHIRGDREMHDLVVGFELLAEEIEIVGNGYRRRAAELSRAARIRENVLARALDPVAQRAVVHEDIERRDLYVVLLDQLARKIAGAVGRNSDLHWHLRSPFPK